MIAVDPGATTLALIDPRNGIVGRELAPGYPGERWATDSDELAFAMV